MLSDTDEKKRDAQKATSVKWLGRRSNEVSQMVVDYRKISEDDER
jgi:hypothetical protein